MSGHSEMRCCARILQVIYSGALILSERCVFEALWAGKLTGACTVSIEAIGEAQEDGQVVVSFEVFSMP